MRVLFTPNFLDVDESNIHVFRGHTTVYDGAYNFFEEIKQIKKLIKIQTFAYSTCTRHSCGDLYILCQHC